MLFWFLARKISLGCFQLEGGEGGRGGELSTAVLGQKCHRRPPRAAGALLWLIAALPAWDCLGSIPLPPSGSCCAQCKLGPGGDAKGPSRSRPLERRAGKGCPVFGTFSSLSLGNSPTHPHEHQKDIKWFIELLVCSRRPLSAMPCR